MKYRIYVLFILMFAVTGCATVVRPTNECRVSLLKGNGRLGDLINYGKGEVTTIRVVRNGSGCKGVEVGFERADLGIKVDVK